MNVRLALDHIHIEHSALISAVDWRMIEQFAGYVEKNSRIFTLGRGRSGLVMTMFAMRLMHLGKQAHVIGEATTPAARSGDLLIAASASGETETVCRLTETARNLGLTCIGLTTRADSLLAHTLDCCVTIPAADKDRTEKTTHQFAGILFEQAALLLVDAIVLRLADQTDMRKNHANIE